MPTIRDLPDADLDHIARKLLDIIVELGEVEEVYGDCFPGLHDTQNELNDIYFRLDKARKDCQMEQNRRVRAAHRADW